MAWFGENPDKAQRLRQLKLMMEELIGNETTLGEAEIAIIKDVCFKQIGVSIYWMKRALKAEKRLSDLLLVKRN